MKLNEEYKWKRFWTELLGVRIYLVFSDLCWHVTETAARRRSFVGRNEPRLDKNGSTGATSMKNIKNRLK